MAQLLHSDTEELLSLFKQTRETTIKLFKPLNIEDAVIQSDTFGSPPNWHIAHVTWFFHKVLEKHGHKIKEQDRHGINLSYLNSYYQRYGNILAKSERGRFPRPTVQQTLEYRKLVDEAVSSFLKSRGLTISPEVDYDITLGIQHEMQHQELMVYDFQHYFQRFPDPKDNYRPEVMESPPLSLPQPRPLSPALQKPAGMAHIPGGIYELGFGNGAKAGEEDRKRKKIGFCYDNELPEHKVYLQPYKIDVAPVTNGDFAKFVEAGGYQEYKYWLADGWELVEENGWNAPLYWHKKGKRWIKKDFRGLHEIDPDEPVVNVSFYEADAYARWAGKRLPTEAEWEKAASWNEDLQKKTLYPWGDSRPTARHANLMESWIWSPTKVGSYPEGKSYYGCHQMIGDVWEWTSSEYVLYPGFLSRFPEYTDKWAVNQKVLRGGCFATPRGQIRNSYRNYFKPHERIVFAGFRCAKD
jgi:ergothioneine biosynthesis protein EgtB